MQGKLVNQFMNEKAGMGSIDKATIAATIERLTAGTPKALHEKEMQENRCIVFRKLGRWFVKPTYCC